MREMGWGWGDLLEAPPEIVDEIVKMLNERVEKAQE